MCIRYCIDFFFFFKQKTAYEMRISDWSSDVCSSDLFSINAQTEADIQRAGAVTLEDLSRNVAGLIIQNLGPGQSQVSVRGVSAGQIGRASCRERVCQYV